MAETEEEKVINEDWFDETQMHVWIHPNGWFEMNVKAKDLSELSSLTKFMSEVLEKY